MLQGHQTRPTGPPKPGREKPTKRCVKLHPKLSRNDRTDEAKYPVERIIRHIGSGDFIQNVVRWYGYRPRVDPFEPPRLIPNTSFPDIGVTDIDDGNCHSRPKQKKEREVLGDDVRESSARTDQSGYSSLIFDIPCGNNYLNLVYCHAQLTKLT